MTNTTHKQIHASLKAIPYIRVGSEIKTWFDGDIVGWICRASSEIRFPHTIKRLQEEINTHSLPVIIVDDLPGEMFRVMIKL